MALRQCTRPSSPSKAWLREASAERGRRFSSRDAWHGRHHYALRLTRAIVNVMLSESDYAHRSERYKKAV